MVQRGDIVGVGRAEQLNVEVRQVQGQLRNVNAKRVDLDHIHAADEQCEIQQNRIGRLEAVVAEVSQRAAVVGHLSACRIVHAEYGVDRVGDTMPENLRHDFNRHNIAGLPPERIEIALAYIVRRQFDRADDVDCPDAERDAAIVALFDRVRHGQGGKRSERSERSERLGLVDGLVGGRLLHCRGPAFAVGQFHGGPLSEERVAHRVDQGSSNRCRRGDQVKSRFLRVGGARIGRQETLGIHTGKDPGSRRAKGVVMPHAVHVGQFVRRDGRTQGDEVFARGL